MEMLFECVTESIHKVTQTTHPHPGCEGLLVRRAFRDIQPKEVDVTRDEFTEWLAEQKDIRNYLLQYIDARFLQALQTDFSSKIRKADVAFREFADDEHSISFRDVQTIMGQLDCVPVQGEVGKLDKLLKTLGGYDTRDRLNMNTFRAVIVPWIGVGVMDFDNSGSIDINELKSLLWVMCEKGSPEPHEETVRQTMAKIDLDYSGEVDRLEWVEHNEDVEKHQFATRKKELEGTLKPLFTKMYAFF